MKFPRIAAWAFIALMAAPFVIIPVASLIPTSNGEGTFSEPPVATPAQDGEIALSENTRRVLATLVIGGLTTIGVLWQVVLFKNSRTVTVMRSAGVAPRIVPAAIVGVIVLLGVVLYSSFELIDEQRERSIEEALSNIGRAFVLALMLPLKSWLGPLTVMVTLGFACYFLFSYGELRPIPFIQSLFDWVFSGAPSWMSATYTLCVAGYALGGSIYDSANIDFS